MSYQAPTSSAETQVSQWTVAADLNCIRAASKPSMGRCCCELAASAADATSCGLEQAVAAQDIPITASDNSRTAAAALGCAGSCALQPAADVGRLLLAWLASSAAAYQGTTPNKLSICW